MATPDSGRIHDVCEVRRGLYVLHPEFKRVNFYSQQLRALALVEAIHSRGLLPAGTRNAAVIGAGVAGLTAAAALATTGANVVLFDEHDEPLFRYRDAVHREIHPNIIAWPFQRLRAITDLPFLNWCCGTAPAVREQIKRDWDRYFASKITSLPQTVRRVEWGDDGIVIHCDGKAPVTKDVVIITSGFLEEISGDGTVQSTYWHSATMPPHAAVTISGVGDGGLIDAACQFYGHKTVAAGRALAYALDGLPAKQDILAVESEATRMATGGDLPGSLQRLARYYTRVTIEDSASDALNSCEIDEGRHVNLYYRNSPSPYKPFAAPINKLMLSYCRSKFEDRVVCIQGTSRREADGSLSFEPSPPKFEKDAVLMRHGAPHGAYAILDAEEIKIVEQKERDFAPLLGGYATDSYDSQLFSVDPIRAIAPSSLNDFLPILDRLLRHLLHYCHPNHSVEWEIKRNDNLIRLKSDDATPVHVSQMFPLIVHGINIEFVESDDAFYSTPPSTVLPPPTTTGSLS